MVFLYNYATLHFQNIRAEWKTAISHRRVGSKHFAVWVQAQAEEMLPSSVCSGSLRSSSSHTRFRQKAKPFPRSYLHYEHSCIRLWQAHQMTEESSQTSAHQIISVIMSVILSVILIIISGVRIGVNATATIPWDCFFFFIISQQADYTFISEVSLWRGGIPLLNQHICPLKQTHRCFRLRPILSPLISVVHIVVVVDECAQFPYFSACVFSCHL